MLVFVDETEPDGRTALHKYGYSLKGTPATVDTLLVCGRGYSTIAAMALDVHITGGVLMVTGFTSSLKKN